MSDRIEERRQADVHDQKRLQQEKTTKEKEASATKFKTAFSQKSGAEVKQEAQKKEQGGQKQFNQNLLMSRNGIANRSVAERLVKSKDEDIKQDRDLTGTREKDLISDTDRNEFARVEGREEGLAQAQQFDAPVKNDEQAKDQGGQQQQGQGTGQNSGQQSGQQQNKDKDESTVGGIAGSQKAGKPEDATGKASGAQNAGKVAIGKTMKAAAAEGLSQPVMQGLVDKVSVMATQGMQEVQIQLKDDALGGGTLRVTIGKDKKLQIAFTLKDQSAKNLIESSKGTLMRMFERKGMALESLTVKLRGEG